MILKTNNISLSKKTAKPNAILTYLYYNVQVKHEDTICKPHLEGSNMNFVKATNTSSTNVQE